MKTPKHIARQFDLLGIETPFNLEAETIPAPVASLPAPPPGPSPSQQMLGMEIPLHYGEPQGRRIEWGEETGEL